MEMPRFTRRYPAILDTLIKQMLNLAQVRTKGKGACEGPREGQPCDSFRSMSARRIDA